MMLTDVLTSQISTFDAHKGEGPHTCDAKKRIVLRPAAFIVSPVTDIAEYLVANRSAWGGGREEHRLHRRGLQCGAGLLRLRRSSCQGEEKASWLQVVLAR